jgi:hypothetical protein
MQDVDIQCIYFKNDTIYQHSILRINYTTYDVRRSQDMINPKTDHRDVLLLAADVHGGGHEYRYARVIGITMPTLYTRIRPHGNIGCVVWSFCGCNILRGPRTLRCNQGGQLPHWISCNFAAWITRAHSVSLTQIRCCEHAISYKGSVWEGATLMEKVCQGGLTMAMIGMPTMQTGELWLVSACEAAVCQFAS